MKIRKKRYYSYEERFILFSNFIEKIFKKLLLLFILFLLVAQLLLSIDGIRDILVPVEKIEGTLDYIKVLN